MPSEKVDTRNEHQYPSYFTKYLTEMDIPSKDKEIQAYQNMIASIESETDEEIKEFLQDTLEYYCNDCSMLLSYIWDNHWVQWIEDVKIKQQCIIPIELYISLENILARQCDSSSYTKLIDQLRYPLTIPSSYPTRDPLKTHNINSDIPRARFVDAHYRLGVHRFYVIKGIKYILHHLEERYHLDFEQLENLRQKDRLSRCAKLNQK